MKLKKIASLALAGIMAVSMLAGCNGSNGGNNGSSSSEVTTVSGAAAAINAELDENKELISFSEDSSLDNVVKAYFASNPIAARDWKGTDKEELTNEANDINSVIGADWCRLNNLQLILGRNTDTDKISCLVVYGFNAKMFTQSAALKYVGQYIDHMSIAEENSTGDKNYTYDGIVSVNEVKSKGSEESVWVIALEITKGLADK